MSFDRHVLLSGCSGGGKSTLLAELRRRGFATVEEPGRRIVAQETACGGDALPWIDLGAFARRALALGSQDRTRAPQGCWVFFDRGEVDAATALMNAKGIPLDDSLGARARYHQQVFLTPPWPEIYEYDADRRHGFQEAEAEYQRLTAAFHALSYDTILLPRLPVNERADFLLDRLRTSVRTA